MEGEAEKELNACPYKTRRRLLRLNHDDDERKLVMLSSANEPRKTPRKQKPPLRAMPYSRKVSEDATKPTHSQSLIREPELGTTDIDALIAATVPPYVSEVQEHLQHHLRHTTEGNFRHGSILGPQFGKDNDRIINECQHEEERQKLMPSYREHFYRKQGDRLQRQARGEDSSSQQGEGIFRLVQNSNHDFCNKNLAQVGHRYNKLLDDPMAKYGIRTELLLADPATARTSADKYGVRAKVERLKAHNYCMDCRRLQFRVRNLEAEVAEFKKNDRHCETLKSEQLENERLKKRVEALVVKRDPIVRLQTAVDRLERSQRSMGKNEDALCIELQRARECIEWFRERNEWLENRVQVLAMQHTQQRNMIQVLGDRSR